MTILKTKNLRRKEKRQQVEVNISAFRGTDMTVDVVDLPLDRLACLIHNDPLETIMENK